MMAIAVIKTSKSPFPIPGDNIVSNLPDIVVKTTPHIIMRNISILIDWRS